MKRIVYLCDWLPPDFGAVGQYAQQACRELAAAGNAVALVGLTSGRQETSRETAGGGEWTTVRVPARVYDRGNWARRAVWTWKTNLRLVRAAWPALRACDEIVFTGSPPFLLHLLAPLNLRLRKRLVYRISDFYPECLAAALGRRPLWLRLFQTLTDFWRRRVDAFQVLGEDQRRRLEAAGVPAEKIVLRRDDAPVPVDREAAPLPRPPALSGFRVLLYSGNWGVAHDCETFVQAYRRHHAQGSGTVALWINAIGAGADTVEVRLRQWDLPVHRTHPVPLEQLAQLLVTADAHLITLRDAFVGYVLPSKVYGCIASGKPVLFIGSAGSDVDRLCRQRMALQAYRRCDEGDVNCVFQALESFAGGVVQPEAVTG